MSIDYVYLFNRDFPFIYLLLNYQFLNLHIIMKLFHLILHHLPYDVLDPGFFHLNSGEKF